MIEIYNFGNPPNTNQIKFLLLRDDPPELPELQKMFIRCKLKDVKVVGF